MSQSERVIAYIDGFNLYYGLKDSGYRRYYWLNIQQLVCYLLKSHQRLIRTKYFTARISRPADKVKRQGTFLEALATLSDFDIFFGHYLQKPVRCMRCHNRWMTSEEKMTDVNIASEMLSDAYNDRFDTALLISADSDLVPPVSIIRSQFPEKRIVAAFPPKRFSGHLKSAVNAGIIIGRGNLAKSQFPDIVVGQDGYQLSRPDEWR